MAKVMVKCFNKEGLVEIDPEQNSKASFPKKIVYSDCPVCGANAEMDLLYHGNGSDGMVWACGHEAHYQKGQEPKYY